MTSNTKTATSAVSLIMVLFFALVAVSEVNMVKADPILGVIRIMPDGTVEGTDKIQRDGDTYTLTGDVNGYLNTTFGELSGFLLVMKDKS